MVEGAIEMRKSVRSQIAVCFLIIFIAVFGNGCNNSTPPVSPSESGPAMTTPSAAEPTATITASPTSTPAPSATSTVTGTPTPIAVYEIEIPADIVWFNTKILLQTGQHVVFSARGKSNISGQPGNDIWDPDGDKGYCPLDCLLPGEGYGTLIGKFPGGLPFVVGTRLVMDIASDGRLLLAINDNESYYFDNTGFYTVKIQVWRRSDSIK